MRTSSGTFQISEISKKRTEERIMTITNRQGSLLVLADVEWQTFHFFVCFLFLLGETSRWPSRWGVRTFGRRSFSGYCLNFVFLCEFPGARRMRGDAEAPIADYLWLAIFTGGNSHTYLCGLSYYNVWMCMKSACVWAIIRRGGLFRYLSCGYCL